VADAEDVERVRAAVAPLCGPLHDAFVWADRTRRERLPELAGDPAYGWHSTHTVRALAHHRLALVGTGTWRLAGNHARNGELSLTDQSYRLRVLHAQSGQDVPPAGTYRARYRSAPLPVAATLIGPADDRLLALWRIDPGAGVPVFRVVRPIGDWRFGGHAIADLDFVLPPTAGELATLVFEATDAGLELDVPDEREPAV
jgi:hypothetical protein